MKKHFGWRPSGSNMPAVQSWCILPGAQYCAGCKEKGHSSCNKEDKARCTAISQQALCSPAVLRYDPDAKDLDVFNVIGKIYHCITASIVRKLADVQNT